MERMHVVFMVLLLAAIVPLAYVRLFNPADFKITFYQSAKTPAAFSGKPVVFKADTSRFIIALAGQAALIVFMLVSWHHTEALGPVVVLLTIFIQTLRLYTSKLTVYENGFIWQNIFKRREYFFNEINEIYLKRHFPIGGPRRYSFVIIPRKGRKIRLWLHRFKNINALPCCFNNNTPFAAYMEK